jgi:hypothetical protein
MIDADGASEQKEFYLDVPARNLVFFLKGSGALDWGLQKRLARIFSPASGKTVMVAIDHGYFQGPTTGLERVKLPLVLHGGTGLTAAHIGQTIRLGVAKLNFGTVLKQRFLAAMREKLASYHEPMNPHPFLGMGGQEDVLVAAREAVAEQVKALLESSGAPGKAGGLEQEAVQMSTGG